MVGNSPDDSPGRMPGGSPHTMPGGSTGDLADSSVGDLPDNSPDNSPGTSVGGSPDRFQVLGDSVFLVDVDGRMAPSPVAYAIGLIEYLQQPEYEVLHGRYVTVRALEKKFYPEFLRATAREHIPWRTVSAALGRLARDGKATHMREFRDARGRGRKRKPRELKQFLVPCPQ